ncbi:hypothetical protein OBBRIDRAFT_790211 [Obba rivulosa]|uniref:Uncharacterized protein n=1 Tax=Obba rivulosa TaxID=1052685 RepID=A0A8E2J2U4_9APHY|nr:hypothetical protein OBBRIDRAFT_790211 [Obba rivulosa]
MMGPCLPQEYPQELIPDWVTDDAAPPYSPVPPADMPSFTPDLVALGYATAMRWSMYEGQVIIEDDAEHVRGVDAADSGDDNTDDDTLHEHSSQSPFLRPSPSPSQSPLPCSAPFSYSCPHPETCPCSFTLAGDIRSSRFLIPRSSSFLDCTTSISSLYTLDDQLERAPQEAFAELCYAQAVCEDFHSMFPRGTGGYTPSELTKTLHSKLVAADSCDLESDSDCDSLLDPELKHGGIDAKISQGSGRSVRRSVCDLGQTGAERLSFHVSFAPSSPPANESHRQQPRAHQTIFCCPPASQQSSGADAIGSFPRRPRSEHGVRSGVLRAFAGFRAAFTG